MTPFCMINLLSLLELRLSMLRKTVGCGLCFALLEIQINSFILHDYIVACYLLLSSNK